MKHKTLTIIFGMIFLIGILTGFISADRTIDDIDGIYIDSFIAGDTVRANFSYSYLRDKPENPDNSPLILRINITSSDKVSFPVWRSDFEINGFIERYILFGLIPIGEKYFTCSEKESQTIVHPLGNEPVSAENGTFYCYDSEGDLDFGDFNTRDIIYLDITSHPALWPGSYDLTAELFYLPDIYPPFVNITNKADFENIYYRSRKYVEVIAEIKDINLYNYNAKIITPAKNYSFYKELIEDNKYRFFFQELPDEIPEGNHTIEIFAEDTEGNNATDETRLLIDETPPEIVLVEPIGGIYSEIIPIKFNVIDEKAGMDNESVQARLREIKEGIGLCPETGGPVNGTGCITTPWINLTLVDDLFEVNVNTTYYNLTSGEYWLDAVASDILGNKAEWIA